jgi:agmatine deiminase
MMPAEDAPHDRTWMCWPSSKTVWGSDLSGVQDVIIEIALAIAEFEPVSMLARPREVSAVRKLLKGVEVTPAPVDDLWARDSLPNFLTRRRSDGTFELAAGHARFNGWGGEQISSGDTQLAGLVAKRLGVSLKDSGLVGEGGGIEVDGTGTVLAAASSWVNPNRNPGRTKTQIESALLAMLGGRRMIWIDGLAGRDITDGHIDTLARFVNPSTIIIDKPAFNDPADPWVAVAARTRQQIQQARTATGGRYTIVEVEQPSTIRGTGDDFLATYMNYYVCNGAVIAPQFGDAKADRAARTILAGLFPDRNVIQINIDPLAAGGGGIHCATQQQPWFNGVSG